jgi:hypothetical protein
MASQQARKVATNGIPDEGLYRWYQANKRFVDLERARLFDKPDDKEPPQATKPKRA